jgi:hypothetical protein
MGIRLTWENRNGAVSWQLETNFMERFEEHLRPGESLTRAIRQLTNGEQVQLPAHKVERRSYGGDVGVEPSAQIASTSSSSSVSASTTWTSNGFHAVPDDECV